jgi:hypothetical protein
MVMNIVERIEKYLNIKNSKRTVESTDWWDRESIKYIDHKPTLPNKLYYSTRGDLDLKSLKLPYLLNDKGIGISVIDSNPGVFTKKKWNNYVL